MKGLTLAMPHAGSPTPVSQLICLSICPLQAIEAKEGLELKPTGRTAASTTFQSFFGFYDRLAGMTVGAQGLGL